MAVVQISKIQIRRDIKDAEPSDDLPVKLSSGEFAWCIDTNQLYIGTYEVSDPQNTRNVEVLTKESDIFSIGSYAYGPVYTLDNSRKTRTIQERLDDRVNAKSFNVRGDQTQDESSHINRAIVRLYKDTLQEQGDVTLRATLEFSPGIYEFLEPIYIYSYTKIVGSGVGRTIFRYKGTGSAFIFVDDSNDISQIDNLNQCRFVSLKDFSLEVENSNTTAFNMYCVRHSEFENLNLSSTWDRDIGNNIRTNSVGMLLGVKAELITCEYNQFLNVSISDFRLGISARGDIIDNVIRDCKFEGNEISINFGYYNINTNLIPAVGEQYGPRNNVISTCSFYRVQKHAIKVWQGYGNISSKNNFKSVGNNRGGNIEAAYGQVEFDQPNNISTDDFSDRHRDLGFLGPDSLTIVPYISEVTGYGKYQNNFTYRRQITFSEDPVELFRFPIPKSSTPNIGPISSHIEIEYLYRGLSNAIDYRRLRKGCLTLLVDARNFSSAVPDIEYIDDYDYLGYGLTNISDRTDEDLFLEFEAALSQQNNQWQVKVSYKYNVATSRYDFNGDLELGTITYTYRILS
ncbi:hypothetical protein EBU71_14180 [bacterium]|nr:hypothetical protein [Candidatus Elulimicrobium humile]